MKKIVASILLILIIHTSFAQKISEITISNNGNLSSFSFSADQGLIIHLSPDGNIIEWGTALEPGRMGYYPGKLQSFMGKTVFYPETADISVRGKIKSLGTCEITYFNSFENDWLKGKVKSIGNSQLLYYMQFENEALKGKLKSAGMTSLKFYSSFDNQSLIGKLKSVDNTSINYYTSFDDKVIQGKLKNIGTLNYTWYTSYDRKEYQGLLKSGLTNQFINGINFILKNY